jgi:tetratricopeptide (TPR) repeat protein
MDDVLTDNQVREHDRVYRRGWKLIEGKLLIADRSPPQKLGWLARRKLRQAIACFDAALKIAPHSWQSLWAMGKIHQRLGERPEALGCFARAHQLQPSQPDVAREAGIAASDMGDGPAAVRFTKAAIASKPEDAGLVSNLALALLIHGEIAQARAAAAEAHTRAPHDPITKTVHRIVDEVAQGKRPRPKTLRELY